MSLEPPIPRSESHHAIHYTIVKSATWALISYDLLMLSYLSLLVACKVSFDIASAWILILLSVYLGVRLAQLFVPPPPPLLSALLPPLCLL